MSTESHQMVRPAGRAEAPACSNITLRTSAPQPKTSSPHALTPLSVSALSLSRCGCGTQLDTRRAATSYATHPPHHIRAATVVSSKGTQQYLSHRGVVKVTLLGAYAVPPLGVAPVAPLALHMPHAHTLMQHDAR